MFVSECIKVKAIFNLLLLKIFIEFSFHFRKLLYNSSNKLVGTKPYIISDTKDIR